MGKITGFMEIPRAAQRLLPVEARIHNFREFVVHPDADAVRREGARCMDCGIPYCQSGCPVENIIPDWNDLAYRDSWREALAVLHSTNNFPEFTGRVCPAPCEAACTLNINDDAVAIKSIERAVADRGWESDWIAPDINPDKTGKRAAVVGSGPAGLACAQQLARAGHEVAVFEKNERPGGLLRYGIPDFKMEKHLIDRRLEQMRAEGVTFHCGVYVGGDADKLLGDFDAVALCGGCEAPRDLPIAGRDLGGIHFAMDYLPQQNRRVAGEAINAPEIGAAGKYVVVIGGGDTGSDCIGTARRQGARAIVQLEVMPRPPENENKMLTWPDWPLKLRTSSSQEEGCEREFAVVTKAFLGEGGAVKKLAAARVRWEKGADGKMTMAEIPDSAFEIRADLVLLAMGYLHPVHDEMLRSLAPELDGRGNVQAPAYRTSRPKLFAAGDMRRGQSLVVWAIREGRQCARAMDEFLMGESQLPR